jgi:predicted HTH transcriptional regulator
MISNIRDRETGSAPETGTAFAVAPHKSMTTRELWDALGASKQGTLGLLRPLIKAGLVKRVGTKKAGQCILA